MILWGKNCTITAFFWIFSLFSKFFLLCCRLQLCISSFVTIGQMIAWEGWCQVQDICWDDGLKSDLCCFLHLHCAVCMWHVVRWRKSLQIFMTRCLITHHGWRWSGISYSVPILVHMPAWSDARSLMLQRSWMMFRMRSWTSVTSSWRRCSPCEICYTRCVDHVRFLCEIKTCVFWCALKPCS